MGLVLYPSLETYLRFANPSCSGYIRPYFVFNLSTLHTTQGNVWENALLFLKF